MQELEDSALLREYLDHGSEEAFATLVARHVNKVYSVALRHTGNSHSAEEITQAVFVILACKSPRLRRHISLSGWLYQTARLTSVTFVRSVIRRARREEEAHMQTLVNEKEPDLWPEIAPLLDAAMAGLNETDRHAVILRYFDGKSMKEVGAALGSNEEAARKRLHRALEKLRLFFSKRGVSSTPTVIAGAISANSVQAAPLAMAKSLSALAISKGAAAGGSTSTLITGTLKLMAWTKLKIVALAGVSILLVAGTVTIAVKTLRPEPRTLSNGDFAWKLGQAKALPNTTSEQIWAMYSQLFASGLRGPEAVDAVSQMMTKHQPVSLIRLAESPQLALGSVSGPGAVTGVGTARGHVRMGAYLLEVLRYAYDLDPQFPQNRIIVPNDLAVSRYDYIDTLPVGGREILRQALKNQFGIQARREMRGNLALTVRHPGAPGLHPHTAGLSAGRSVNVTMRDVAARLGKLLGVEVTDQTGLAGGYDFTLTPRSPAPDDLKDAVLNELGLELVPAVDSAQIEFLIAERVQ